MSKIHVINRDPSTADEQSLGFSLGDVAINRTTGARWWLAKEVGIWMRIAVPETEDDEIDADIIVTGTFTPPAWNFVAPSPDIGGSGVTAAEFAIAPTGWWLVGDIDDGVLDFSGAETIQSVNVTGIIGTVSFIAKTEAALTEMDFNSIKVISGQININGLPALQTFGADGIESMTAGSITLANNSALTGIDLSALNDVADVLDIELNISLTTLDISSLDTVGGDLNLSDLHALTPLDISNLETVGGDLYVYALFVLEHVSFPALTSVGGEIIVHDNSVLLDFAANFLTSVGEDVTVQNNESLESVDLSALTGLTDTAVLSVIGNAALASLDISAFLAAQQIEISANPDLVSMTPPDLLHIVNNLLLDANGFDQASVDAWLQTATAMDGTGGTTSWDNKTLDLSGGTNSPPSGAGLTDKATLEGRGNTVLVNSAAGPIVSSGLNQAGNNWQVGDPFSLVGYSSDATFQVDTVSNDPIVYAITATVDHTLGDSIIGVNQGTKTFTASGDITANLVIGLMFHVLSSTGNDGTYHVDSFAPNGGDTDITVLEAIPDATVDGGIESFGVVSIDGDHVADFTTGLVFVSGNSGGLDGPLTYQLGVTDFDFGGSGKTRLFTDDETIVSGGTADGDINILGEAAVVTYHMTDPGTAYSTATNVAAAPGGASIGSGLTLDITI